MDQHCHRGCNLSKAARGQSDSFNFVDPLSEEAITDRETGMGWFRIKPVFSFFNNCHSCL